MKRITIGRNPGCDIVFDQRMVSRNHALINIYPTGKYEIVNMGTNGTKVNGTLISSGQRYPLKRGDSVIFAGEAPLDWRLVPDPMKPWRIAGFSVLGAALAGLLIWGIVALAGSGKFSSKADTEEEASTPAPRTEQTDTTKTKEKPETEKETLEDILKKLQESGNGNNGTSGSGTSGSGNGGSGNGGSGNGSSGNGSKTPETPTDDWGR